MEVACGRAKVKWYLRSDPWGQTALDTNFASTIYQLRVLNYLSGPRIPSLETVDKNCPPCFIFMGTNERGLVSQQYTYKDPLY